MNGRKVVFYDIFINGRFDCTMRHYYMPCFQLDYKKIIGEVFKKRPSLQNKRFDIVADDFRFTVEPTPQGAKRKVKPSRRSARHKGQMVNGK